MISAALDIQGERAHQSLGESSTVSVPGSRQINVPGTKALAPVASQNPNKKKVLFVTSEIADLVKTGGLGDVSAALPRAMAHLHDVRVLIPGYPQVVHSENPIHIAVICMARPWAFSAWAALASGSRSSVRCSACG